MGFNSGFKGLKYQQLLTLLLALDWHAEPRSARSWNRN